MTNDIRPDFATIADWIPRGSHVLDLGCGDGTLLNYLTRQKGATGYGLEIDDQYIPDCIRKGLNVIQTDLDQGLSEFDNDSFDYVVLSLTLQAVRYPDRLLKEMLRVGTVGIVTFPNFGHWSARFQLGVLGKMPMTRTLPNRWYNTPNIHLCTLSDFEKLCRNLEIAILQRQTVDHGHKSSLRLRLFPKMLGEIALYRFQRKPVTGNS